MKHVLMLWALTDCQQVASPPTPDPVSEPQTAEALAPFPRPSPPGTAVLVNDMGASRGFTTDASAQEVVSLYADPIRAIQIQPQVSSTGLSTNVIEGSFLVSVVDSSTHTNVVLTATNVQQSHALSDAPWPPPGV